MHKEYFSNLNIFYVNSKKKILGKHRYLSKNESASEPTKTNFHMKQISG